MTAAFLLNAIILASLITLVACAAVPLLRNWNTRAAYVFAVMAFFAAALAPMTLTSRPHAPSSAVPGQEIAIREDLSFLSIGWLGGVLLLLARESVALWNVARRHGRPLSNEDRHHLGVPRGVVIQIVEGTAPMTVGALRPRIILSREMVDGPPVAMRAVLAHEIDHVRWRDPLVNGAVRVTLVFLWPVFPLWALERLVRREREAAADVAAVADLDGDAVCSYAETMLAWARRGSQAGALGIAESDLEHRVARLFRRTRLSLVSIAASLAALAFAAAASTLAPAFRYRPEVVPLSVERATLVQSMQSVPRVERPVKVAPPVRSMPAPEREPELSFGLSFSDLDLPGVAEKAVDRHVAEEVHVAAHEHRTDPPKDPISETIVIRDVWRHVIRIRN